jgi:hypothetical protein
MQQPPITLQLVGADGAEAVTLVRELIYDGVLGTSYLTTHIVMLDLRDQEPWVGILPAPR